MSTICDSCKQPMHRDDGYAQIMVNDPMPDYTSMSPEEIKISMSRRPSTLDVCAACVVKLVTALELAPDTFTPRPPPADSRESPPAGALTDEDLIKLGLKEGAT